MYTRAQKSSKVGMSLRGDSFLGHCPMARLHRQKCLHMVAKKIRRSTGLVALTCACFWEQRVPPISSNHVYFWPKPVELGELALNYASRKRGSTNPRMQ